MKKIIALVLCLVMVFALCACGESNTATTAPAADTATEAPALYLRGIVHNVEGLAGRSAAHSVRGTFRPS